MTETELEYQFCFNCNDRKQCYTKPKECTRIKEEIGLQSNIEWMREASLEELAEVFGSMLFEAWKDGLAEEMHNKRFYENLVDFWLKQPHTKE